MKVPHLSVGLLSIASLITIPFLVPQSAFAQCVQSHTGVQLNMGKSPAEQTHNTQFDNQGSCTGNVNSSTATQVNLGGNNPRQHQEVRQETRGGRGNPSGVNGPTVSVDVVTPVNVQTPENFPY
ncbi:hypothetical protein [Crocosphaera chwakensis]|uniref:Secreted protein n=1 Tax=Crocosphaera chwakensis CCY0110 TaxID=391612 RepID=A3IP95_9CHRO|nr:hypothetical protein [Crocosphaera chwakensis]EAZ91660.1 hypothetical protein CY0110_26053 [Crocosphaera chwakensis CCY0110]